jgi:hypothetical protein
MGIAVASNRDVWIADGSKNQLLLFPPAAGCRTDASRLMISSFFVRRGWRDKNRKT